MLTFAEACEIAAKHYGEPFARAGVQDDGVCLVTPQRVVDDEARGLITVAARGSSSIGRRARLNCGRISTISTAFSACHRWPRHEDGSTAPSGRASGRCRTSLVERLDLAVSGPSPTLGEFALTIERLQMSAVEQVFLECERARAQGVLIQRVSASDKEFHFQNWVQDRLDDCALYYDEPGRNTYPDFTLVNDPIGFEVKGLAYPGRAADYDANSQVPSGLHNGREVYYVFGRYPKDVAGEAEYPVLDLIVCHGDFLNADSEYEHLNRSFRGFGSYGDILVRDRKMYVVPTPLALTEGTTGLATLIVPASFVPTSPDLVRVGELVRVEVDEIVGSYEFDLQTNEMITHYVPNPNAGAVHTFHAYRSRGLGDGQPVSLREAWGA